MNQKIPATIDEQIAKMRQRGCIIEDEQLAQETLRYINYFRLSDYFAPFTVRKGQYEPGTSFEKILRVYEADRKLRSILLASLEETEIAMRAAVSNYHALKYGALGYLNPSTFDFRHNHQQFMNKVKHLIDVNDDREFVRHYNSKYCGAFPLWVVMELFSFGTLAFFYKDMQSADKKEIADKYYGCSSSELDNWLFCLNELRNYCAHYNRLYGNKFPVEPKTPRGMDFELSPDVFGYIIVMKQLAHNHESWNERVVKPVSRLIKKNSDVLRLKDLGFPEKWEEMILYSDKE